MVKIKNPNLLQEVYMLYQVEPNKVPQEIPSTGEIIGYDIEYQEFTELKCYKLMKRLFDLGIRLDIDKQREYSILVQPNQESNMSDFFFTEEDKSLEKCMLKVLITIHDELLEHLQIAIKNELEKEI